MGTKKNIGTIYFITSWNCIVCHQPVVGYLFQQKLNVALIHVHCIINKQHTVS